jgi:predicted ArsR family transcriptional regulator
VFDLLLERGEATATALADSLPITRQAVGKHLGVLERVGLWGRQALRIAAQNGRPASVRRLLEHGADANLPEKEGRTALWILDSVWAAGAHLMGRVTYQEMAAVWRHRRASTRGR